MVNKAAAALGRKGGRAGTGAAKARSPEVYGANLHKRWSDNRKRRRSCVVCGRRVLATSREFESVGRGCADHATRCGVGRCGKARLFLSAFCREHSDQLDRKVSRTGEHMEG